MAEQGLPDHGLRRKMLCAVLRGEAGPSRLPDRKDAAAPVNEVGDAVQGVQQRLERSTV
jgi:hypothetical protein